MTFWPKITLTPCYETNSEKSPRGKKSDILARCSVWPPPSDTLGENWKNIFNGGENVLFHGGSNKNYFFVKSLWKEAFLSPKIRKCKNLQLTLRNSFFSANQESGTKSPLIKCILPPGGRPAGRAMSDFSGIWIATHFVCKKRARK